MGRSGTSGCCGARVEDFCREREERPTLGSVVVGGVELEKGSRVLLWPAAGGDIMDLALKGKVASVEGIEQDYEGRVYIAVTLEDDPGRDLGEDRFLGHRFFFSSEAVETLDLEPPPEPRAGSRRRHRQHL